MLDKSFSFILAYPRTVVSDILDKLGAPKKGLVLDPFCGTGTTLVECKRKGLSSIGIEANPVCALAAMVKTRWDIDSSEASKKLHEVTRSAKRFYNDISSRYNHASRFFSAPEVRRLKGFASVQNSGVVKRGWIGHRPALMVLALSHRIRQIEDQSIQELLLVPLLGALVPEFSNVRYGPELYRYKRTPPENVFEVYEQKAKNLLNAIDEHKRLHGNVSARVLFGSSSDASLMEGLKGKVEFVITSPPYPAEHDYSRFTRLELGFGGFLEEETTLRTIKRSMIPSSSKSSYADQKFYDEVKHFPCVRNIRRKILTESKSRKHGFARVYPRLVGDYFGAMFIHFRELSSVLAPGGKCAYVVGDQSSFFGIRIHTARILAKILSSEDLSFRVIGIETLRTRRSTTGKGHRKLPERILYFEKL
jgi:hypothetical protein